MKKCKQVRQRLSHYLLIGKLKILRLVHEKLGSDKEFFIAEKIFRWKQGTDIQGSIVFYTDDAVIYRKDYLAHA